MVRVNVDNFVHAETAQMFANISAMAGGVNMWFHYRQPTPIDKQPVIRMNRDTLYSAAVVDTSGGARITVPDTGDRYCSVMVVDDEHFLHAVITEPGTHELTQPAHGSPYLFLAVRTFIDPADPADVAVVNALQDRLVIEAGSAEAFTHPDYDSDSRDATRAALATLGSQIADTDGMFGTRETVDPVRHLIGSAVAWGGLPQDEALYLLATDPQPVGVYTLTMRDVPADSFWSITVYNRDGYFEAAPEGAEEAFGINSVTAEIEPDGSVVVNLRPTSDGLPNHIRVMDGWNYALRLYRPRPEATDGTWTPPVPLALT